MVLEDSTERALNGGSSTSAQPDWTKLRHDSGHVAAPNLNGRKKTFYPSISLSVFLPHSPSHHPLLKRSPNFHNGFHRIRL